MDVFVLNLTAIALRVTPFLPGAPAVTVNGEAISADASGDFVRRWHGDTVWAIRSS